MITNHDKNLLDILIEIAESLKAVSIGKKFNFADIKKEYKDAIFKVKSIEERGGNIVSSNLKSKSLKQFYEDHACCWVNYIGCDSFSDKIKRQVFFSSILMEDEDHTKNNDLLTINDRIFEIYNSMLDDKIPVDLWVQLFFIDSQMLAGFFESQGISKTEGEKLLRVFQYIQENGIMIPLRSDAKQSKTSSIKTLFINKNIKPVSIKTINCLRINKNKTDFAKELVSILHSVSNNQRHSSYLSDKIFKLNKSLHHKVRFLYYLPAEGANGAVGVIIYGAKRELSPMEIRDVKLLGYNILFPYVSAHKSVWEKQMVIKESIKSAISAIMSRNMSHNLGSHYLYYTKSYLENLANSSGEKGPDIRGAAKVLGYMQARMDYLATIISNDRYPNGAVNFKSQIYDELTIDDFSKRHFAKYNERGKRTTNFLLSNLVMSENFTRSNILGKCIGRSEGKTNGCFKPIRLQVMLWDGVEYQLFTGSSGKKVQKKENDIKNELSKLNIALPGGTMACHAFFNVVENFIRNSAKYLQSDFQSDGLVFTITIRRNQENNKLFDFIIFDNKKNASKVLPVVIKQLQDLKILDESGGVEKSSKGLKEMLFSSVWMRSYKYPFRTFAEIMSHIQNTVDGNLKLGLIKEFGFEYLSISDSGTILDPQSPDGNLGLRISLPEFHIASNFCYNESDTEKELIAKSLDISSDIVCFDKDFKTQTEKSRNVFSFFTRPYLELDFNEDDYLNFLKKSKVISYDENIAKQVYRYKKILDKRFKIETGGTIDDMCLILGDRQDMKLIPDSHKKIVYFERHLNTKKGFNDFMDYAYVDSISGGNFTITLNSLIEEGITEDSCCYKTWHDKFYGLKIKESALTRITLIDERLFNSMKGDGPQKELEYSLKNIRVLNVNIENKSPKDEVLNLFEGNEFPDKANRTHFLSIHLGLIEKIVKSDWGRRYGNNSIIEERVTAFMNELKAIFGEGEENVFISVHSGRGNFSKELEGPLATYPFISLAAIENAFNNSKYLLSQLFYNTIYIGKGIINK